MATLDIGQLATEFYEARVRAGQVEQPTTRDSSFDLNAAYAVEAELARRRGEEGHRVVGRKIGFASKALWRKFGTSTVVWGSVYDDTLRYAKNNTFEFSLAGTVAPKLEPEIVFKLKGPLTAGAGDALSVLKAVEWVALGYEIVDCPYPGWQYKAPDFVAAFGFHTALLVGEPLAVTAENIEGLVEQLATFKLQLLKNGELIEEGGGKAVLGNPALSLGELAEALTRQAGAKTLAAGEVITTGTTTPPPPVAAGDKVRVEVDGLPLPALTLRFTA